MRGTSGCGASGAGAFRLGLRAEARGYLPENGARRIAGEHGHGDDAAAGGFHFFAAHNLVAGPIAAFDEDIREQARDYFARRRIIENHDGVHGFESGENFGALSLWNHRTAFAFQLTYAGIAVEPNDEHVPQFARQFQTADVAGMEQVKTSVGENDAAAVAFLLAKPQNRFLK